MYDPPFLEHLRNLLRPALPRWGWPEGAALSMLNVSENATFLAEADGRRLVLRAYRQGYHQPAEMESELAWITALRAAGVVETPAPVPGRDGRLLQVLPDGAVHRHAVAFAHMPGVEPQESGALEPWFVRLGSITARLHAQGRGWQRPPGFTRKRWDFGTMLGDAPHWGRWQAAIGLDAAGAAVLARVADALRAELLAYGDGPERFGLVHADLRLTNLLVEGERLGVIDFDDCGFCWYLYDFAAAISFIEDDPVVPALMRAWIGGYRQVDPLAAAEVRMLPSFVMLRRMVLTAWLASHAETPTAQALGAGYTDGTVALGLRYLQGSLWHIDC
jgi:Ser/Thr protein kinase RdoA (MazF antagonist)